MLLFGRFLFVCLLASVKMTELEDYVCDQTVIIRNKFLPFVSRANYTEPPHTSPPSTVDWYPYVNSYYAYTEDVDAYERVDHLLATEPGGESTVTITEGLVDNEDLDTYSERGCQLRFLQSKPTFFIILGKPGIGQERLGKLLADHWNCVYLDPETLINEEIEAGTRPGGCIEFNLRCGRAIGIDVILKLFEKRMRTESVKHRGAVICGFPLIQNDEYREDPVSSESAVFNVQDIFEDLMEQVESTAQQQASAVPSVANTVDEAPSEVEEPRKTTIRLPAEETESEGEVVSEVAIEATKEALQSLDVGSVSSNICVPGDIGTDYEQQVDFVFKQLKGQNFVIVYVMCPSTDVINKHASYIYNVADEEVVDRQEQMFTKNIYTLFTRDGGKAKETPEDFVDTTFKVPENDDFDLSRFVTLPRDFPANVSSQLERYHYAVLTTIDRYVLLHDPQYFIKVDGRTTPIRMFNIVKARLRSLPLQNVILPQLLNQTTEEIHGEDVNPAAGEEMPLEDAFKEYQAKNIPAPSFRWTLSDWGYKCPVSMKEGAYLDGHVKFPVSFMNKIFFLSDEIACQKFLRNPRPFLLPPYPKLSCKIFVLGPPYSGKTAVSRCLAYLLDGELISHYEAQEEYAMRRKSEFKEKVAQAAISKAMALLNKRREAEWRQREHQRKKLVKEWMEGCKSLLQEYQEKITPVDDVGSVDYDTVSSFPIRLAVHISGEASQSNVPRRTLEELEAELQARNIICTDDYKLCKQLLVDDQLLQTYLPEELKQKETSYRPATVFDDFVQEHIKLALTNAVMSRMELRTEDMAEMYKEKIRDIETKRGTVGGWILDGIPPNWELLELMGPQFHPHEVFVLQDTPSNEFLIRRFHMGKQLSDYTDFRDFFMERGRIDAALRAPHAHEFQQTPSRVAIGDNIIVPKPSRVLSPHRRSRTMSRMSRVSRIMSPRDLENEQLKRDLNTYQEQYEPTMEYLKTKPSVNVTYLQITDKSLPKLLDEVIETVDDKYRQQARVMSDADRTQELLDYAGIAADAEEVEGEGAEENKADNALVTENRRYGDTYNYCPVTFHQHWVLWKGKEKHAVKYEDKVYLCCNEEAMRAFVQHPRRYLLYKTPPASFPPPRICVVGPRGSGKKTIAHALSNNYGLYFVNYKELLRSSVLLQTNTDENLLESYLTSGDRPLPVDAVRDMLHPLWFEDPIKNVGFALVHYPLRSSDVDYMEQFSYIPDMIVELYMDEKQMVTRNTCNMMEQWEKQMEEERAATDKQNKQVLDEWNEKRTAKFKAMMEERRTRRYKEKLKERKTESPPTEDERNKSAQRPYMEDLKEIDEETDHSRATTAKSQISYDSVAEQEDMKEVNAVLDEQMPEPVFEDRFESKEDAKERFESEMEGTYMMETEYLKQVKEYCVEMQIPWYSVNANVSLRQVIVQVMRLCGQCKFRNKSCFERCFEVSLEIAEKFLACGYCFLSSYGRTCPVQCYEKYNPIQMFFPLEAKGQVYAVVHRYYVYFLAGKENREKFFEDPLKYIGDQSRVNFPLLPVKLAISGPPKCGKTILCERFARDLGLKVISRGKAIRYVLEYLSYCQLAKDMDAVLRKGWELTDKMVMQAVQAASFDVNCLTQGMVFDGFPRNEAEMENLADVGLAPNLVIDLFITLSTMRDFLKKCVSPRPGIRLYSNFFMLYRYKVWSGTKRPFQTWLDREYQITALLPVDVCMWGMWNSALELTLSVFSEIQHYYKHIKHDWPLRIANMKVTPLEFLERSGYYRHYCPCCLHHSDTLKTSGNPPDRTGLIHFRKYFYWVCDEHIEEFLETPEAFLPPYNNHSLPVELPEAFVYSGDMTACYEEGICVVCYKMHQPKQYLVSGQSCYAIKYMDVVYLFDSPSCMQRFAANPRDFLQLAVTKDHTAQYPVMDYLQLRTLGMLEQYVSRQIVKAITHASITRPLVVGMDATMSACVTIGLFLKLNNPRTPAQYLRLYREAQQKFERRVELPKYYLQKMKDFMNPRVRYQEPMPEFVVPEKKVKVIKSVFSEATVSSGEIASEEVTPN